MRFLMLSGIGWLLSLAGLCCWLLIVICALRILLPHVWSNLRLLMPSYAPKLLKYAAGLGFLGLSFFAVYHAGYSEGQLDFLRNRYGYTDVLVLERYSDREFSLQPARMQPFPMTTCEQGMDWKPGQKMKYLHFQWHPECNNVGAKGDFEFYRDSNGKRIIYQQEISNARY